MKNLLILIFTMGIFYPAFSQKYLEYSSDCMNRMVYKLKESKQNEGFVSYQIHLGNQQYVHLEVGKENTRLVQSPPEKPMSCSTFPLGRRVIDDINQSKRVIYIAKKERNGYVISPVKKAVFFQQVGPELSFVGKDVEFALNFDNPTYGRNLALADSENKVFLDGVDFHQCSKGYILRKTEDVKDRNYKEFTFSPSIGIIEKRAITLLRNRAQVNVLSLESVDGVSVDDFIAQKCIEIQATTYDRPTNASQPDTYASESTTLRIDPSSVSPSLGTKGGPCGITSSEGTHVVTKGETLYGIARRYGISLAQLKTWNGIDERNIIHPCQQLRVISASVILKNDDSHTVVSTTTSQPSRSNRNSSTSNNNKSNTTTSSSNPQTTFDRTYLTGGIPAWAAAGTTHIVKPGETIFSIAKKYGYTEERLRWMNGMGEREQLVVNQVIRIDGCNEAANPQSNSSDFTPYLDVTARIEAAPSDIGNFREFTPKSIDYSNVQVHIVQAGETLYSIARDYGTSIERIRELNGFSKGEVIMRSQRIYVD